MKKFYAMRLFTSSPIFQHFQQHLPMLTFFFALHGMGGTGRGHLAAFFLTIQLWEMLFEALSRFTAIKKKCSRSLDTAQKKPKNHGLSHS